MNIDLRKCKKGDILISSHGAKLIYVRPTEKDEYLDHVVKYTEQGLGYGTRTHNGWAFQHSRDPKIDHDIVQIIPLRKFKLEKINATSNKCK